MDTSDIDKTVPSKWIPITDPPTLAVLGKLQEELGECMAIVARCIIQGVDECNPETGRLNRMALEDEIADVSGLSALLIDHLKLDKVKFIKRANKKYKLKEKWIDMLKEAQ